MCHLTPEQFNLWCDNDDDVAALACDNGCGTLKAGFTRSMYNILYAMELGISFILKESSTNPFILY